MDIQKVGEQIASLRKSKCMTQNDLGDRLGVSFQAVSKWERGETLPDTAILLDLAAALETTVDFILRGGESSMAFKGRIKCADMARGIECLSEMGELLGKRNIIYRCAVEGINERMNTDIEAAFGDEYYFECFVAEAILGNLRAGMYVDPVDVKNSFRSEHFRQIVLDACEKYGIR